MRALVVYESLFGNTEQVARALADGLGAHLEVELCDVAHAPLEIEELLDLIVVGGPTHAFSMSRANTREEARRRGADHDTSLGIREWLDHLHRGPHSELVATFDTRVRQVEHLPGSAAHKAQRELHKLGYSRAAKPESFYVEDVSGPLVAGELQRARAWGDRLGREAADRAAGRVRPW